VLGDNDIVLLDIWFKEDVRIDFPTPFRGIPEIYYFYAKSYSIDFKAELS
jgi:hypothetical protein